MEARHAHSHVIPLVAASAAVGAFVAVAAVPLIIDMLVAAFTVHLPSGFSFMNVTGMTDAGPTFGMPGMEIPFLYIAGLLALLIGGAGAWSLDARRAGRSRANLQA